MDWKEHQEWERHWWEDCTNTFAEEVKQISYAARMGLKIKPDPLGQERWPMYDMEGKSVMDIGGGPVSMLLKAYNFSEATVVDPCEYPQWTMDRYAAANIGYLQRKGEDVDLTVTKVPYVDEVWVYNCLQHTERPDLIARNARMIGKVVRVFEWLNIPPCPGHPQELKKAELDEWYRGYGSVEQMNGENACHGLAYFGVFG